MYYHLIWATKDRAALISPDLEPILYGYIIGKAHSLECITHAIGGLEDHIHLVVSIPPKLSISDFVKAIKGSSAHYLNHSQHHVSTMFGWQRGYGIFSLGSQQLAQAVEYARNQKQHHRRGTLVTGLEHGQYEDHAPRPWHNGEAIADIQVLDLEHPYRSNNDLVFD
jgi:putative transposase